MPNTMRLVEEEQVRLRQRLSLNIPVCLVVKRPDKVLLIDARFRDISDDGAALYAAVELAIDSEVQVEFTPRFDHPPLRVRAIVRNRRKYVYGLEFFPHDAKEDETLKLLRAMLLPIGSKTPGDIDNRQWE